jgi:hypothetical protein
VCQHPWIGVGDLAKCVSGRICQSCLASWPLSPAEQSGRPSIRGLGNIVAVVTGAICLLTWSLLPRIWLEKLFSNLGSQQSHRLRSCTLKVAVYNRRASDDCARSDVPYLTHHATLSDGMIHHKVLSLVADVPKIGQEHDDQIPTPQQPLSQDLERKPWSVSKGTCTTYGPATPHIWRNFRQTNAGASRQSSCHSVITALAKSGN